MKVFIAHSSRDLDLVASLMTILREDGHDVFDPTSIAAPGNVLSEISAGIRSADVLVAVVRAGNPNVFYELGLAAGAGVPILIAAPAGELLPSDLGSVPYVQLAGDTFRDAQIIARRANELRNLAPTEPLKFESAEAALRAAVREPAVLESLSPADFERLVMELFKERGYAVTAMGSGRDTGVDFVIEKDNELVVVEVKKLSRQSRVSVETVRRLLSAIPVVGASLGILVATSGYTTAALSLAAGTPATYSRGDTCRQVEKGLAPIGASWRLTKAWSRRGADAGCHLGVPWEHLYSRQADTSCRVRSAQSGGRPNSALHDAKVLGRVVGCM